MATASTRLITAEEFIQMPQPEDGSRQELIRGVIVTAPPPGGRHGVCCMKVARKVGNFVDEQHLGVVTCNDAGFITERAPDTIRGPDVAYWRKERLPEVPQGYIPLPPDLAVEVVSPEDHFARMQKKVRHYLTHGVALLWVVDPDDRSVTVYRPGQDLRILDEGETLTGEDVLPGFSCRVDDLMP